MKERENIENAVRERFSARFPALHPHFATSQDDESVIGVSVFGVDPSEVRAVRDFILDLDAELAVGEGFVLTPMVRNLEVTRKFYPQHLPQPGPVLEAPDLAKPARRGPSPAIVSASQDPALLAAMKKFRDAYEASCKPAHAGLSQIFTGIKLDTDWMSVKPLSVSPDVHATAARLAELHQSMFNGMPSLQEIHAEAMKNIAAGFADFHRRWQAMNDVGRLLSALTVGPKTVWPQLPPGQDVKRGNVSEPAVKAPNSLPVACDEDLALAA
jgi:hypothetical protein